MMKVEDFYNRVKADGLFASKSRLLIIRNHSDRKGLRQLFEERPNVFQWVRLSKCVVSNTFVPPADRVLADVRAAIVEANSSDKIAYVTGMSAMLALWDYAEKTAAFEFIRAMIDDTSLKFWLLVNSCYDEVQSVFSHPRYMDGNAIMVVGENPEADRVAEIRLVSSRIGMNIDGMTCQSISAYLSDFEIGGFLSQIVNVKIDDYDHELAGVSGAVKQIFREGAFLQSFCNYTGGLSNSAEEWLFKKMMDMGKIAAAKDFAQVLFFQGNMTAACREAPRMILDCEGAEQEALVWMLRMSIHPDKYLSKVLSDPRFQTEHFKAFYVSKAIDLMGDVNERALCSERRDGIAYILQENASGLDAEIAGFIELAKDKDPYQVIPWLTNGTKFEKQECVRRLRRSDLNALPHDFFAAFPPLEHYLAPYALGNAQLEGYFTEYRRLKIKNEVTLEFFEKAKEITYPFIDVKSRDDLLKELSNDTDAALLVVDAMGAEYMPLLLSMAKKHGIGVANAVPVSAKIPTSTKFNPISWPQERVLNGIHDLDNIIHNGVHVHGATTDEENLVGMLEVFSEIVIPRIAQALVRYRRVVLTADHGASRLAVLASRQKLSKTLPVVGVDAYADDWRYVKADPNTVPPALVASNVAGDHWVVKGYDRMSKPGGKLNELHGGLTYEEAIVPLVVFEKGAVFVPMPAVPVLKEQFVENDDFDL